MKLEAAVWWIVDSVVVGAPFALTAFGLGVPYPDLWSASMLATLANISLLSLLRSRSTHEASMRMDLRWLIAGAIASFIVFMALLNRFTDEQTISNTTPVSHVTVITGFELSPSLKESFSAAETSRKDGTITDFDDLLYPRNPTDRYLLEMSKDWDPETIWTWRSLLAVRLGLLSSWMLFLGCTTAIYMLHRRNETGSIVSVQFVDSDILTNEEVLDFVKAACQNGLAGKRQILLSHWANSFPVYAIPADQLCSDVQHLARSELGEEGKDHPLVTWIKTARYLLNAQPKQAAIFEEYLHLVISRLHSSASSIPSNPAPQQERPQ